MKKATLITSVCLVLCLLFVCIEAAHAESGESIFFLAGRYFHSAKTAEGKNAAGESHIVASYNGHEISSSVVEYNRNMNIMRDDETAKKYSSDVEIANQLITNILITEEAAAMGLSATQDEIDLMVNNAIYSYSLPEGKEIIDAFCKGAGITVEEYFEYVRKQAPEVIARQKVRNEIGRQYCEDHGIEYTNINPPLEMIQAQNQFITDLFEQHKAEIVYFIDSH